MNDENLVLITKETAREYQKKSAQKRKENTAKRKFLSEMYADFLADEYNVTKGGETKKITGTEYVKTVIKAIVNRGDSSSVAMLKEIREATEGNKINISGSIKNEMESTEDRLKIFDEITGNGKREV